MTPQPILISVILDKSGSMEPKRADVIGGFNRFVEEQRNAPGRARMIITQFNTEVTPPTPAVPIEEVLPLSSERYTPGGNTALFDAIAQTVGRVDAEQRPDERVLCLIITDGEENSSRETTLEQVKKIMAEHEAHGHWTFAYLGAGPDRWMKETGMSARSVALFSVADPQASFLMASEATRRLRASHQLSSRSFFAPEDAPSDAEPKDHD